MAKSTQPSMETATWQGQDNCDEMKLTGSAGVLVGMVAPLIRTHPHICRPKLALVLTLVLAFGPRRFGRDLSDEELLVFVEIIESSPVGHTDCHPPATAEAAMAFVKRSLL